MKLMRYDQQKIIDEDLENLEKYDMDKSYDVEYVGTFPVNDMVPIQIMLPDSEGYQILINGITVVP